MGRKFKPCIASFHSSIAKRISNESEWIIIILITKEQALKLNKEYGIPFGYEGISSTGKENGRHKYYLCENKENLSLLKKVEK